MDNLKLIQNFEADFLYMYMESQPQNPEFLSNPKNFNPCKTCPTE